jgi:hypothetical protein
VEHFARSIGTPSKGIAAGIAVVGLGCAVYDKRDAAPSNVADDGGVEDASTVSGSNVDIPMMVNPDARSGGTSADSGRLLPEPRSHRHHAGNRRRTSRSVSRTPSPRWTPSARRK